MTIPQTNGALATAVIRVARRVFTSAHQRFIQPDDPVLVELVVEVLSGAPAAGTPPEAEIRRRVLNVYCQLLYAAFMADAAEEQGRAWVAAQAHIFPWLAYRLGDRELAADLAQNILTDIWRGQRKKPMDDPRSFLGFIRKATAHALSRAIAKTRLPAPPDEGPDPPAPPPQREIPIDSIVEVPSERDVARPTEAAAGLSELVRRTRAAVEHCLHDRPRWLNVIVAHMLEGKSFAELAQAWHVSALQLAQDKFHALRALAVCPEMQQVHATS